MFRILDSLYQNSSMPDKIYNDFTVQAQFYNYAANYQALLDEYKKIIAENLTSPVSALVMLDVDGDYVERNKADFTLLLEKMSGRAL